MDSYDIFNGDADGIIALHQWRMHSPSDSTLITGVKRDIALLQQVPVREGLQLTVFDISLRSNIPFLKLHLANESKIIWFDHHQQGDLSSNPSLTLHLDLSPKTCTSQIVNTIIGEKFSKWAAAGAFGDNLFDLGEQISEKAGCSANQREKLKDLGQLLNYNAYGESIEDLHFTPTTVYEDLNTYPDPIAYYDQSDLIKKLQAGFHEDLNKTATVKLEDFKEKGAVVYLPDEKWARRVIGTYANQLSSMNPDRAHAILLKKTNGWLVSVRAPENNPVGADILCSLFQTGGGRSKAAGINFLPDDIVSNFLDKFTNHFS